MLHGSELMAMMATGNEASAIPKVVHPAVWLFALRRPFSLISCPPPYSSHPSIMILSQVPLAGLKATIFPEFLQVLKSLFTLLYLKSVLLDVKSVADIFLHILKIIVFGLEHCCQS